MKKYSLGFAFDAAAKRVVLIQKKRPSWQKGHLNGVGGHVEEGETFHACMAREFFEETGVETYESNWRMYARLFSLVEGKAFEMHVFSYFGDEVLDAVTKTDERVYISPVERLFSDCRPISECGCGLPIISNLTWLIPAALDGHFNDQGYLLEARYSK